MSARILVVEDEEALTTLLRYNLDAEGYEVETVGRGDDADTRLKERVPDLIVLDWMLPGLSGIELCRRLRARPETKQLPIIMLTARGEESERVRGLATGADDYIVKPFSVPELLARVKGLLRRASPERLATVLTYGDIELDREKRRVARSGRPIDLGPTEYRLLEFFLEHPGRVFSREQLLDSVWGRDIYIDERTVDVHIGRLRKLLNPGREQDPIRTVRGAGYALDDRFAKVEWITTERGSTLRRPGPYAQLRHQEPRSITSQILISSKCAGQAQPGHNHDTPVAMGPGVRQARHLDVSVFTSSRRLRRLAATVAGGLIGDARVVRAVGQAGERLAAAEKEFRARGIADRPVAGGLVQFQQRQPLAHRHHIVVGDRIRLQLDFESMRERGVAARDRTRHPHHVLGRPGLALARRGRGGTLGAAGKAQPMHFADYGVSRHISKFRGDLAGRKPGLPRVSSVARRDHRTRSIPSSHVSLRVAPADHGTALRCQISKIPAGRIP